MNMQRQMFWMLAMPVVVAGVAVSFARGAELTVDDFDVSGSDGAKIERVATNRFKLTLGRVPQPTLPTRGLAGYPGGQNRWANWIRFRILRNAKGNALRLDVEFPSGGPFPFTNYAPCWSYDGGEWTYLPWKKGAVGGRSGTLLFPEFTEDKVLVSTQLPMTVQDAERLIERWRKHPHVKIHVLGKSLEGRNLYRVEITDPARAIPRSQRWVHHVGNQHPGEGVAPWHIAGMVQWFLTDEAAEARKRTIGHFTLMMNPDGVAHGWCRVNAQGIDMNRSFSVAGPNAKTQPHEAFIFQRDIEGLMKSEAPITMSWSMHSAGRPPVLGPFAVGIGPEIGNDIGALKEFSAILKKHDSKNLIAKLRRIKLTPPSFWDAGLKRRYGISNFLVEGGGGLLNKRQCLDAGAVLMKALTEYYAGHKKGAKDE